MIATHPDESRWRSPEAIAAAGDERRAVWAALSRLPPSQRAALALRELYGFSYAEIATALDTSTGAVEILIFRARRRFREHYGKVTSGAAPLEQPLRCKDVRASLAAVLDAESPRGKRRDAMLAHVRSCPVCQGEIAAQRRAERARALLPLLPLPLTLKAHLLAHVAGAAAVGVSTGAAATGASAGATAGTTAGIGAAGTAAAPTAAATTAIASGSPVAAGAGTAALSAKVAAVAGAKALLVAAGITTVAIVAPPLLRAHHHASRPPATTASAPSRHATQAPVHRTILPPATRATAAQPTPTSHSVVTPITPAGRAAPAIAQPTARAATTRSRRTAPIAVHRAVVVSTARPGTGTTTAAPHAPSHRAPTQPAQIHHLPAHPISHRLSAHAPNRTPRRHPTATRLVIHPATHPATQHPITRKPGSRAQAPAISRSAKPHPTKQTRQTPAPLRVQHAQPAIRAAQHRAPRYHVAAFKRRGPLQHALRPRRHVELHRSTDPHRPPHGHGLAPHQPAPSHAQRQVSPPRHAARVPSRHPGVAKPRAPRHPAAMHRQRAHGSVGRPAMRAHQRKPGAAPAHHVVGHVTRRPSKSAAHPRSAWAAGHGIAARGGPSRGAEHASSRRHTHPPLHDPRPPARQRDHRAAPSRRTHATPPVDARRHGAPGRAHAPGRH